MAQQRLRTDQIAVGAPLPFDAYDSRGVLLLRRGSIIASASQLERLIENGLYSDDPTAAPRVLVTGYTPTHFSGKHVSVIGRLDLARKQAAEVFACDDAGLFPSRLIDLARFVRATSSLDPDAALGDIVASRGGFYPARHAINCASLGGLLMERVEATEEEIETTICALLTMNLSMVALQDVLYRQAAPLDAAQREAVAAHPANSAALLKSRGVDNAAWIAAVVQHHELPDGSGYPAALADAAIGRPARLMAMVDQYCALVSERAFREGVNPGAAIRHLLVKQGKGLDSTLCTLLLRELTPYPPGAAVRLANNELAVVCRRTRHPDQPIVRALVSGDGRFYPEPRKRVTSQTVYHVDKPVAQGEIRNFPSADTLWDDTFTAQ